MAGRRQKKEALKELGLPENYDRTRKTADYMLSYGGRERQALADQPRVAREG